MRNIRKFIYLFLILLVGFSGYSQNPAKFKDGITLKPITAPSNPKEGTVYYDLTQDLYFGWNGSEWLNLSSTNDVVGTPSQETDVSAIWIGGLTFDVRADKFPIDGKYYSATRDDVTLDAADGTFDRIDLLIANSSGAVGKITGIPSANPAQPSYQLDIEYAIKFILVKAAQTTPDGFQNDLIFDEDVGTPTEWDWFTTSGNLAVTSNDAYSGTLSIEGTNIDFDINTFTKLPLSVNLDSVNTLNFWIKLKDDFESSSIWMFFYKSGVQSNKFIIKNGKYGFDSSDLSWQQITIDVARLNFPPGEIDQLQIIPYKPGSLGYFIDLVGFQYNTVIEPPPGSFVGVEEAPEDGLRYVRKNKQWEYINLQKEVVDSYELTSDDNGYTIWLNKATAFNITVTDPLPDNFECYFYNVGVGVGTVTFIQGIGTTLDAPDGFDLVTDKIALIIKKQNENNYKLIGQTE